MNLGGIVNSKQRRDALLQGMGAEVKNKVAGRQRRARTPEQRASDVGAVVEAQRDDAAYNHPAHYGGADDPYEAIKVIEAWNLGFCLGNTLKYIKRAPDKGTLLGDLKKARWYLDREISALEA